MTEVEEGVRVVVSSADSYVTFDTTGVERLAC
jgi:hypothetical protein